MIIHQIAGSFFSARSRGLILLAVMLTLAAACKPQVSVQVNRDKIQRGEEITVTWTSKNAKSVAINGEPVNKTGSRTYSPTQTTTYEALARRGDKEARAFARVEVEIPAAAPALTFTTDRDVIQRGESTTLRWSASNAQNVEISGLGLLPSNGSRQVSPTSSTTYTATARGPGGIDTKSARVTVNEPTPPTPTPTPPTTTTRNISQQFMEQVNVIYFAFDSADLDEEMQSRLRQASEWLKLPWNRSIRFRVEGHCDERGTEEYNIGLGDQRANAVRDALISLGIEAARIDTISYGETKPADMGHNERAWALNRRAEFVYLSGGDAEIPFNGQ